MSLVPWLNKGEKQSDLGTMQSPIARLRQEMDDMFGRLFGGSLDVPRVGAAWGPRMDLAETEKEITVSAEIPGVRPGDIDVSVTGNILTIRGEKKGDKEERRADYHYVERQYGSFQRSIQLPVTVDAAKVDASFKDGVLTVSLAKHPEARPKRIPVKNE